MVESSVGSEGVVDRLKIINWFGVATGVLMLILPFLGAWWQATVGADALHLEFSPFYYHVSILGQAVTSSLVGFFILAAKLTVIIGGGLMIAGSLATDRWWGKKLMRFGAMKVFWYVILLIGLLLVGAFLANNFLPGLLSKIMGGGGASMQLNIPYLVGTSTSAIQAQNATISAPLTTSLTSGFVIAVVTAGLGIATRIYHGRLVDKLDVDVD